jgi:hypothetical protein
MGVIESTNVAEFLRKCVLGDIISSNELCWVVIFNDYEDGEVLAIAKPYNAKTDFEIWSCGLELHAELPLKVIGNIKK